MSSMIRVVRRPVLMEDEGRYHVAAEFETLEEAEAWIAAQDEYFKPSDYLVEPQGELPV